MTRACRAVLVGAALCAIGVAVPAATAVASPATGATAAVTCSTVAAVTASPNFGPAGSMTTVSGTGYCLSTSVVVVFKDVDGVITVVSGDIPVAADGTFSTVITVPAGAEVGHARIHGRDAQSHQCPATNFDVRAPGV
ncbi:MAG TPA: hypothetical protein VGH10_05470 [Actinomycetota bacterium]